MAQDSSTVLGRIGIMVVLLPRWFDLLGRFLDIDGHIVAGHLAGRVCHRIDEVVGADRPGAVPGSTELNWRPICWSSIFTVGIAVSFSTKTRQACEMRGWSLCLPGGTPRPLSEGRDI
jgi:hypothetical protein